MKKQKIEKKRKGMKPCIGISLFIFVILLCSPPVLSLGVTPVKTDLQFESEKTHTITINIVNNERKDMDMLIYTEKRESSFFDIKPTKVSITSEESMKSFSFTIILPQKIKTAGTNEIPIIIKELPQGQGGENNEKIISATVEVIHRLNILVPYPGKYVDADIIVTIDDNEAANDFTIPLSNKGKQDLKKIIGTITIFDSYSHKKITTIQTNTLSLPSGGKGKLTADLDAPLGTGRFKAVLELIFDGETKIIEKEFFTGTPQLDIVSITIDKFKLGSIAKLDIWMENKWNQKMDNVFADMIITDNEGREKGRFKTVTTSIEPNEMEKIEAYWDTSDIQIGEYGLTLITYYAGLIKENIYTMDVGKNTIKISGSGITGAVIGDDDENSGNSNILALSVIALVLMNVLLLIFIMKKNKNKERRQSIGKDQQRDPPSYQQQYPQENRQRDQEEKKSDEEEKYLQEKRVQQNLERKGTDEPRGLLK